MKCMSRITKTLLGGGLGLVLGLALAVPAVAQTTITVDFDALDTSGGPVSGATLDDYLAGFGITLTIPAGGGVLCLRTRRRWVAPIMSSLLPNPTSWNRLTEQLLVE